MSYETNAAAARAPPTEEGYEDYDGATQPNETEAYVPDPTFWGCLRPLGSGIDTIWFKRSEQIYRFGRNEKKAYWTEYVMLRGSPFISLEHCEIHWEPGNEECVRLKVSARNGVWVDKKQVIEKTWGAVRHGDEVGFGTPERPTFHPGTEPIADHRYIFQFVRRQKEDTGELLKKYVLFQGLGIGTFGSVIKAKHKDVRKDGKEEWFAVKIIRHKKAWMEPYGAAADGTAGKAKIEDLPNTRVKKEVANMKKLAKHRHICQLVEFFCETHWLALLLEYVDGGDLQKYMDEHHGDNSIGELSFFRWKYDALTNVEGEHKASYFTYQICDGLAFMHRERIAHRDLKPANILLTAEDPPQVKIVDFGLSKAFGDGALLKTVCGTGAYMAPEVQRYNEGYDERVDSWSLGVVVSEMVTSPRRLPYDAWLSKAQQVIRLEIFEDLSEEVQNFLCWLLQKDSKQRMDMTRACNNPWLAVPRRLMARLELASDPGERATGGQDRHMVKDANEKNDAFQALHKFFHSGVYSEPPDSVSGEVTSDTIDDARPSASEDSPTASKRVVAGSEAASADISTIGTSQARRRTRSSTQLSDDAYSTQVSKRTRHS